MRTRGPPSMLCLVAALPFERWSPAVALRSGLQPTSTRPFPAGWQRHTAAALARRPPRWNDEPVAGSIASVACAAADSPVEMVLETPSRDIDATSAGGMPPPLLSAVAPGTEHLPSSETSTASCEAASADPSVPFLLEQHFQEEEEEEVEVSKGWGEDFQAGEMLSNGAEAVVSGMTSAALASRPLKRKSNGEMVVSGQGLLNLCILVFSGLWAIHSVVTVDAGMWRGWTLQETLMRLPWDNWDSYEYGLLEHPIATKTAINVGIYLIGDWLSQVNWGKEEDIPLWEFDLQRTLRNGLIGALFGPVMHYYYNFSDWFLPVDVLTNRPLKIMMDQSLFFVSKCTVYITLVSLLRGDSFDDAKDSVKSKLKGVVTTGWRFWPFVHIFTYFLIPPRHRVLWVNCVDLLWSSILAGMTSGTPGDGNMTADADAGDADAVEMAEAATLAREQS